jgi:hypothetical protein
VVDNQQAFDTAHVVNVKGIAAVRVILSKRSYDQQGTLLPVFSCWYLGLQQQGLGYTPPYEAYVRLSVFFLPQ